MTNTTGALDKLRAIFESEGFDIGATITGEIFDGVRDALFDTVDVDYQPVSPTAEAILEERLRQRAMGYDAEDNAEFAPQLVIAAQCYGRASINPRAFIHPPASWPWDASYWKPETAERMRVKAGALLAAAGDAALREAGL